MRTLWDELNDKTNPIAGSVSGWHPSAPPSLDGIRDIELDTETNGLRWWAGDRPIGISIAVPGGVTQYLPWGHKGGGNLDESVVKEWAQRELRGKRITNLNTRFDIHHLREWGVDLEAQGNEVSDVGHYAALLDDHRKVFSLDTIARDYLGEGKIEGLDKTRMEHYHAGEVAAYAEKDVLLVQRLREKMWPMLGEQDLHRVRALEDRVIYVVCEMEKNGSPVNHELLESYIKRISKEINTLLLEIAHEAGFQVNPSSGSDMARVFAKLKLPVERTEKGAVGTSDDVLKRVQHPLIVKIRRCKKLISLKSKSIHRDKLSHDGIFRYALHQLKTTKDENAGSGESGTVTGRFSSSEIAEGEGDNIQNRPKPEKQRISFGYDDDDESHDEEIYLVRRLHVPGKGMQWLSGDMMQVEYRMFAALAGNPKVLQAYRDDPEMSFHKYMLKELNRFIAISYGKVKDCNFARVYGAGLLKLALMTGEITGAEYLQMNVSKLNYNDPRLKNILAIDAIYNQTLPEAKKLIAQSKHIALPKCTQYCNSRDELHRKFPHQGFVTTILGRRSRFPNGYRNHKALNSIIQGGAADVMKQKLVELHEARHDTGFLLRASVHDEVDGDVPDVESARKVRDILNRQSFSEVRIPLLWDVGIGPSWADCEKIDG
jgi:DNA polymerase-1